VAKILRSFNHLVLIVLHTHVIYIYWLTQQFPAFLAPACEVEWELHGWTFHFRSWIFTTYP
jgi:hypothetical protein